MTYMRNSPTFFPLSLLYIVYNLFPKAFIDLLSGTSKNKAPSHSIFPLYPSSTYM